MKFLHWLPIEFRTKFKLLTTVFKTLQGNGPGHLQAKLKTKTYQRTTRRSTAKGITLNALLNKRKLMVTMDLHIQLHHIGTIYLNTSG